MRFSAEETSLDGSPASSRALRLWAAAALLVGLAIRASSLFAARPYIAYVDEGNFLHPVIDMLRKGDWDPRYYVYPQLPLMAVAAAVRVWAPAYRVLHGRPLIQDLSPPPQIYDLLEPFDVLIAARVIALALEAAIIVLTGLFARRLAGPRAGLAATWLAALTPALAIRGAIATVDPDATFFALVCLMLTDRSLRSPRRASPPSAPGSPQAARSRPSIRASSCWPRSPGRPSFRRRAGSRSYAAWDSALAGLLAGAVLAMPALITHSGEVVEAIRIQAIQYAQLTAWPPLWRQAFLRAEWDLPYEHAELGFVLVAVAAAGLVTALRNRATRATACGWIAFGSIALALYGRQAFQPFRNLLPLVPIVVICAALFYADVRDRLRKPGLLDAAAFLWILIAFAVPLARFARERFRLADPRTQAVDLLVRVSGPGDEVLVEKELGILRRELSVSRALLPSIRGPTSREPRLASSLAISSSG